jgi:hypothetical protein
LAGSGQDAAFQALILAATTAFWDAYLKGDRQAKAFLVGEGLTKTLGDEGMLGRRLK